MFIWHRTMWSLGGMKHFKRYAGAETAINDAGDR